MQNAALMGDFVGTRLCRVSIFSVGDMKASCALLNKTSAYFNTSILLIRLVQTLILEIAYLLIKVQVL